MLPFLSPKSPLQSTPRCLCSPLALSQTSILHYEQTKYNNYPARVTHMWVNRKCIVFHFSRLVVVVTRSSLFILFSFTHTCVVGLSANLHIRAFRICIYLIIFQISPSLCYAPRTTVSSDAVFCIVIYGWQFLMNDRNVAGH